VSWRIGLFCLTAACTWAQFTPHIPRADESEGPLAASGEAFNFTAPGAQRTAPAGTISADELAHPISRKGVKLLLKAKDYSKAGEHGKAIEQLYRALQEPSAAPLAHSMLGIEYLKIGRIAEAVAELEVAVQLLPQSAPNRSNFGYALYLAGERERAEREVRKALLQDSSNSKTRHVLNVIEGGRGQ
jgi:Flp pilus assembly protein TadD